MEKEASLVTSEDDLEEQEEQEVSEKGEGAKMEVRSGMRWWARMWRKMRVGNSAEMRDLEPGAR